MKKIKLAVLIFAAFIFSSAAQTAHAVSYRPSDVPVSLDAIIRQETAKYNLPRWFYYAVSVSPILTLTPSTQGIMARA